MLAVGRYFAPAITIALLALVLFGFFTSVGWLICKHPWFKHTTFA